MRRLIASLTFLGVLALNPSILVGQDVIPRPLNPQEIFEFVDAGAGVVASWDQQFVGPYTGNILSGNPTLPGITLYCVDFANTVPSGKIWTADLTNIGAGASDGIGGTLGNTRLGNAVGSLARYQQVAYLSSLFSSWQTFVGAQYWYNGLKYTFSNQTEVWSGIHAAIWSITTTGFPSSFPGVDDPALAAQMAYPFVQYAANNYGTMSYDQWSVVTDVNDPGAQEFLIRVKVSEPASILLLLAGLGLMGFMVRRQKMQAVL